MTPWIKVENGLPPTDEYVIGYDGETVSEAVYYPGTYPENDWYWKSGGFAKIKFWQPLPKPPGEK